MACAAENGIDVFRLHDPLNDVSNLVEAGEAIVEAGRQLHVGLVYSPGGDGEIDALVAEEDAEGGGFAVLHSAGGDAGQGGHSMLSAHGRLLLEVLGSSTTRYG